ncbi:hypothetical protein [Actinoplanes sp. N902-109]|uniref:hypothetical protein n=1 Tax=Actinoplanes sp. (strain N902-109) TaxID=649831 RepID=UPI000329524E|nr:hypothetical protein [Actinoplanes sp. N902-109]AGL21523.1 hypothetical protein L083_8013 [Actinoplanes sp. N902-109]
MTSFILTWDGSDTGYFRTNYENDIAATAAGRRVRGRWSFGSRRSGTAAGDRVYLLRQNNRRGIIASGTLADGTIFPAPHWAGDPLKVTYYADILWDRVLPVADRLPFEELLTGAPGHNWRHIFASGQRLRPPADDQLADLWAFHTGEPGKSEGHD